MRTLRRSLERNERKLAKARRKLWALQPGGSPEDPLIVSTAAVIESRASSQLCPDCGGPLAVHEHRADMAAQLRVVELRCKRCGAPSTQYFSIVAPLPN